MRLVIFLMFVQVGNLMAVDMYAQSRKLTLKMENSTVREVLDEISRNSDYIFFYGDDAVELDRAVDLDVTDSTIEQTLLALFGPTGHTWTVRDRQVIINRAPHAQTVQPFNVSGRVTDLSGKPIPGVNVIVKGTGRGTTTDVNGRYVLQAPDGRATLIFSFMGMETHEEVIGGRATVDISLAEDIVDVDQVVVTGYQTISRERSAGSASVIGGPVMAEKAGFKGDIVESLEGLSTGFSVNMGAGEQKFALRGITSINSNSSPLYVVDGIPMTAENVELMVNENDIANVSVLKDATAASIWGTQAANGVIVITTKRGVNTDRRLRIAYDGTFSYMGRPDYDYLQYMSSPMLVRNAQEVFAPETYTWESVTVGNVGIFGDRYYPVVMPHERPLYQAADDTERDRALAELAGRNNRSQIEEYLMAPKMRTKHSLQFNGGSDSYTFYGSLGYEFDQTETRDRFNRYSLNMRQDFLLTSWLALDLTTTISVTDDKNFVSPSATDINTLLPYMMLRDRQGNNLSHADLLMYAPYRADAEAALERSLDYVPLDETRYGYDRANSFNTRLNAGLQIQLFDGLNYEGRFAYQRNSLKSEVYSSDKAFGTREELGWFSVADADGGTPTYYLPSYGGRYTERNGYQTNWVVRNQFNFDKGFGRSQITALAGMEIQANRNTTTTNNVRGYDPQTQTHPLYNALQLGTGIGNPILPENNASSAIGNTFFVRPFVVSETEYRFVSFYANAAYTYDGKYSLNGSIRVDQSNLFGSDPSVQYKPVWSMGVNWNIGKENFMDNASFVDRLNMRLSYGLGGNSPDPGEGGAYDIISANTNALYNTVGIGYIIETPANNMLRWERTGTVNFGLDFSLFNARLSGSVDIYNKNTTDLLSPVLLNPVAGWTTAQRNMGEMNNKGFEVILNSTNVRGADFEWNTTLAVSYNKNLIKKIYRYIGTTANSLVTARTVENYAMNSIFAYRWAGLDDMGDPQVYTYGKDDELVKVKTSGDMTDERAIKYMGTSQPPWFGSLINNFRYKNFDLSVMIIYNLGHKMRNDVNTFYGGRVTTNLHKDFDKRWRQAGDRTDIPSYEPNVMLGETRRYTNFYRYADINVLSASYIKLRDVTLSYSLPRTLCDKLSAETVKVRFQASNLLYWAANKEGIDPEAHYYSSAMRTTRFGPTFSFGLSINFK